MITFIPVGTILCFGGNGHIEIEFIESYKHSAANPLSLSFVEDICGPCFDIPSTDYMSITKNISQHTSLLLPLIAFLFALPIMLFPCITGQYLSSLTPGNMTVNLTSVQSTVLRI
jgi:hypothetical protein